MNSFGDPRISKGWDVGRFMLMGMPNIESPDGLCCVCGSHKAQNRHHIVPKGMGGSCATTELHEVKIESPTIHSCGHGNTEKCHGRFHSYRIDIKWLWHLDTYIDWWLDGFFFAHDYEIKSNSPDLYAFGRYEITDHDRGFTYVFNGANWTPDRRTGPLLYQ